MKRIIIAHGWDGFPEEGWFPWLSRELQGRGFQVAIPQLPEPGAPRIFNWVPKLAETVGAPDKDTYLVGHSMGCQTIVRYLEGLKSAQTIGGAVFVAGFFKRLTGLEDDPAVQETDRHWLGSKPDFSKVRQHLPSSIAIFSDSDPYVPLDNQDDFRDQLGSSIIIKHGRGHFSGPTDGITEVPEVLEAILKIAE
ncbi:MAG: hypothetical protein DCC75_12420 [Proteobacteria bacterium]|nr:MAG: hypothetical protein DCC75_12420 [Pseudomonadota bacterium]